MYIGCHYSNISDFERNCLKPVRLSVYQPKRKNETGETVVVARYVDLVY